MRKRGAFVEAKTGVRIGFSKTSAGIGRSLGGKFQSADVDFGAHGRSLPSHAVPFRPVGVSSGGVPPVF